jgi:hypothetical protein
MHCHNYQSNLECNGVAPEARVKAIKISSAPIYSVSQVPP